MRLLSLALRLTALFAALAATATAQLVFKTDTVKTTAKAGDATVETRFPFTNRGQDVVNITELGSTCGCTVPELKTRRYAPGESGEITTRFTIGNRTGKQTSHITVKTDAGPHLLTLEIDIPPRINIAPRLLVFTAQTAGPQQIKIDYLEDSPVTLLEVSSSPPGLSLSHDATKPGEAYTLTVRPPDEDPQPRYTVRIRSRGKSGAEHTDTAYVRVKR